MKKTVVQKRGITIRPVMNGADVVVSVSERILGRTAAADVVHPLTGEVIVARNEMFDEVKAEAVETAGVDSVFVRSVLTCETQIGVCGKCYGRDLARGTPVNMGEAVGVMAAQSIGEPGTQLTMRTFHIGGAAQKGAEKSSVEATINATVEIRHHNVVKNSSGVNIVMGRNTEIVLKDAKGAEKAIHRVPYGARLLIADGIKVKPGDKMAEWDPFTIPIITEKDGVAHYFDMVEGVSISEKMDEATGISSKVVVDWRSQPRGGDLKPRISLLDKKGEVITLPNGLPANYYMSVDAILSVENGQEIKAGDIVARIPRETSKTRDITGGLPRVAELFEARRPKDAAIISEIEGQVAFGKDYKAKRRLIVQPTDATQEPREYLIPKGRHLAVAEGIMYARVTRCSMAQWYLTIFWTLWVLKLWLTTSSTKFRTCTACKGLKSTTSTSRSSYVRCCRKLKSWKSAIQPIWLASMSNVTSLKLNARNSWLMENAHLLVVQSFRGLPRRRCKPAPLSRQRPSRKQPVCLPRQLAKASLTCCMA